MTCGPYRPIKLITYRSRLSSVHARALVSQDLTCRFKLDITLAGDLHTLASYKIRCLLKPSTSGVQYQSEPTPIRDETRRFGTLEYGTIPFVGDFEIKTVIDWDLQEDVQLWWPTGYGSQSMYDVQVPLISPVHSPLLSIPSRNATQDASY